MVNLGFSNMTYVNQPETTVESTPEIIELQPDASATLAKGAAGTIIREKFPWWLLIVAGAVYYLESRG